MVIPGISIPDMVGWFLGVAWAVSGATVGARVGVGRGAGATGVGLRLVPLTGAACLGLTLGACMLMSMPGMWVCWAKATELSSNPRVVSR